MPLSLGLKYLEISRAKYAAAALLTSGTLAWFFLLNSFDSHGKPQIFLEIAPNDSFGAYISQILFFSFAVLWALVGTILSKKIDRRRFLISWILLGVFATAVVPFFHGTAFSIIVSLLLGASLGLGLPSSLSFIAESTVPEERGRVSGSIILFTFIMTLFSLILADTLGLGFAETVLIAAVLRSVSLLAFFLDSFVQKKEEISPRAQNADYKNFLFYLLPWVMFNVASGLAMALIPSQYTAVVNSGTTLRNLFLAVFGFASGFVADRFGRRWIVITGLLILAIGFALLGFRMSPESTLIYLATSGIAYGSFFVVFLAVPGDLSRGGSRERFYAMGTILPLAILFSLYIFPPAFLSDYSGGAISQVISLMLFLSIIPVYIAKETLPEKIIRERRIREHIAKVLKLVQESEKK